MVLEFHRNAIEKNKIVSTADEIIEDRKGGTNQYLLSP